MTQVSNSIIVLLYSIMRQNVLILKTEVIALKFEADVKRMIVIIGALSLIFSVIMEIVFALLRFWDYTVLLGNIFGVFLEMGNFLLLCVTVTKSLESEGGAQKLMQASQMFRTAALFLGLALGAILPFFNLYAVMIPLLFVRLAIMLLPVFNKKKE